MENNFGTVAENKIKLTGNVGVAYCLRGGPEGEGYL